MNDELKRFFDSIKFENDNFIGSEIKKVIFFKEKKLYEVIITSGKLITKDNIKLLIDATKNKINGKDECTIKMDYHDIPKDNIEVYLEDLIKDFYSNKPSLGGIDISLEDNNIIISCNTPMDESVIKSGFRTLNKVLEVYGFPNYELDTRVKEDALKHIKEEIEAERNVEYTKEESPMIFGMHRDGDVTKLSDVYGEVDNAIFEVFCFGLECTERKSKKGTPIYINELKVSDKTDSYMLKIVRFKEEENNDIVPRLKEGKWYRIFGSIKIDDFTHSPVMEAKSMEEIPSKDNSKRVDDAPVKRVELHAHTMMSQMDGVTKLDLGKHTCELVSRAISMGYKGVAVTDHNGCQAFPICHEIVKGYNKGKEDADKFKGIYGTELIMVDDTKSTIVTNPCDLPLLGTSYVVFDTETTGFNAALGDQMIEIGAVKVIDGAIKDEDHFDILIDPKRPLSYRITNLTNIDNSMLRGQVSEEEAVKTFLEWAGDLPMVAHNAAFDISFMESAMHKYNLGDFKYTVIDTLGLSRALNPEAGRHNLNAMAKRYDVAFSEDEHHRGDYDAKATAEVFMKMLKIIDHAGIKNINELDNLIPEGKANEFGKTYHCNMIALNRVGLKNMFELISLANTVYIHKVPKILKSKIEEYREGLLIGSSCYESEVFTEARRQGDEKLLDIINFYDYVEVQPPAILTHIIDTPEWEEIDRVWGLSGDPAKDPAYLPSFEFNNLEQCQDCIKRVIEFTKKAGKIIVATGDVHHFDPEDKIYREIIINQNVPGGGRHPLARYLLFDDKYNGIPSELRYSLIPSQHFRTTNEMLEDFNFLDKDLAYEIVVENTNKVLDMVEDVEVIIDTGGVPFSPRVHSDDGENYLDCRRTVTDLVYDKAKSWYGDPLPKNIEERIGKELYGDCVYNYWKEKLEKENEGMPEEELEDLIFKNLHDTLVTGYDKVLELINEFVKEHWTEEDGEMNDKAVEKKVKKTLGGVIGGGFDPIYLIAQRLVKHSNDDGFLVGSRGSVGSSFVATMMGITEVNPLPAHYRCLKCQTSLFKDEEGNEYGATYSSGFDLPDKVCPNCGEPLYKDGQDMPFATFLGFNADKVPDIDLNFSDLNQASAHEYTKVLFGVDNVYRAGTIGTVADKTAYGFVKGYFEDKGVLNKSSVEIERLAMGCTGVKRTTGQHPGGIVVVPDYMSVYDVTPFQFPAEDPTSAWRTTHFDYHSIQDCLLKLDILGHSDPTQLRLIQELSHTNVLDVPLDDKDTMSIFSSTDVLGVTNEEIMCPTGTLGIPEFGTKFTISMVDEAKPTTFAELVKISGLSHGTDVWLGNAQELIKNNIVPFSQVIGCRDDIMVYLIYHGLKPIKAFKIMEFVRKGKASKDKATWAEHRQTMEDAGIESWFIDSCEKIKYMFPKAHAAAYVTSAFRIAWYKVHMPAYFYASWYSTKATDFDINPMISGYDAIKNRILEIKAKGFDATNKENGQVECLQVALEMAARGISIQNFDLYKSKGMTFDVKDDKTLIPPFITIDGLGETVAKNIEAEAKKHPFISIEDFQKRCGVSQTLLDKMRPMGLFEGMPENSQLSLF